MRDKLGGLCLSAEDILARDLFVIGEFQRRRIPVVMLLSGGYSQESYRLVAATVRALLEKYGAQSPAAVPAKEPAQKSSAR